MPEPNHKTPKIQKLNRNYDIDLLAFLKLTGIGLILLASIFAFIMSERIKETSESLSKATLTLSIEPVTEKDTPEKKREKVEAIKWNHLNGNIEELAYENRKSGFISQYSDNKILVYMTLLGGLLVFIGEFKGILRPKTEPDGYTTRD